MNSKMEKLDLGNGLQERIYFLPGEVVTLKQDIPNKPKMVVEGKDMKMVKSDSFFRGIKCFWFNSIGELQRAVFNTKDLIKI